MFGVQGFGLVLRKVMQRDAMTDRAFAFIRFQCAGQHLEQRAFSGPVFSHEGHALPSLDRAIDPVVDYFFPIALGRAFQLKDLPAARRGEGELELYSLRIALDLNHLDLLKLLDARLNLAGFVGLVAETIDEGLHPGYFFRLTPGRGLTLRVPLSLEFLESGIVASIFFDFMVPEIPDVGDDTIEERRVVTDEQ